MQHTPRRAAPKQTVTTVRTPVPLREKIRAAAERNGRTEGAEMRARLELSFLMVPIAG